MTHRTPLIANPETPDTKVADAIFGVLIAAGQAHLIEDQSYLYEEDATTVADPLPDHLNEPLDAGVLRTLRRAA